MNNIKQTKAKCPKCKSKDITIVETSNAYQSWIQTDGIVNKEEGIMNHGDIISVNGICDKCNHKWKFKCSHIDELIIKD